jgi:hypothetical protein
MEAFFEKLAFRVGDPNKECGVERREAFFVVWAVGVDESVAGEDELNCDLRVGWRRFSVGLGEDYVLEGVLIWQGEDVEAIGNRSDLLEDLVGAG